MLESLGHYRLVEQLREDPLGTWHRAWDERLGRDVLVMVFRAGVFDDADARGRALRSARVLSRVDHPNIARVCAFDRINGVDGAVLEWAAGGTPRTFWGRRQPGDAEVARVGRQVADALSAGHEAGIVHGALQMDRVLVTERGQVKVVGFGWPAGDAQTDARPNPSAVITSLDYMSPEQLADGTPTVQGDVYSLGAILYEMATGVRPYEGATVEALREAALRGAPQRVRPLNRRVSVDLERIILRCLSPQPHLRYALAADVSADLCRVAGANAGRTGANAGRTGADEGRLGANQRRTGRTRHRAIAGSVLAVAIVLVVVGWAILVWFRTGFQVLSPQNG